MLIEVNAKVSRIIDSKLRKRTETYLTDKELFAEAEYQVMSGLSQEQELGTVEDFDVQSIKQSPIKEIVEETMSDDSFPFIATLKDLFHDDNGNEKSMRYNQRAQQLARQGYDMQIEGIKQVEYEYLAEGIDGEQGFTREQTDMQ